MAIAEIDQGFEIPCGYTNCELNPSVDQAGLVFQRLFEAMEIDEDSPIKASEKPKPNVIWSGPAPVAPIGRYETIRSGSTYTKLTATGSQLGQDFSKQTLQSGLANTAKTDGPDEGDTHASFSYGKDNLGLDYGIKKTMLESPHAAKKKNGEQIQFPAELLLMRPARQRIELFRQPYTRDRFMEVVRTLYRVRPSEKPLFYLAAVDVSNPSKIAGFPVGEGVSVEEWDDQLAGLVPHINGPRSMIRVVKLFSNLTLRDGRNTLQHRSIDVPSDSIADRIAGLTSGFIYGTGIQPAFNKALIELMAAGPEPVAVERVKLQVARYQGEWLEWYADMPLNDFLSRLLWKVDDPIINVYPSDWIPKISFEESLAEGKSPQDVSPHDEAQAAAAATEKFLNHVETLLGYDRGDLRDRSRMTGELINLFWAEHVLERGHTAVEDKQSLDNAAGMDRLTRAQRAMLRATQDARLLRERSKIRRQTQLLQQQRREFEAKEAAFERLQAHTYALRQPPLEPSGGENCPHPGCSAKVDAPVQNHIGDGYNSLIRCPYNGCHALLNLLSESEKAEHEDLHAQAQAAANRRNDVLENGQELIVNTEGFSEAQLELVGKLREALHEMQKLQLEKQTLETAIRSERRDAERLVRRIATQNQEIETLQGSLRNIESGSKLRPLNLETGQSRQVKGLNSGAIVSSTNPPALGNADQPIHAQGSKGSRKKEALPKCPDGTKRFCPVCLLNIHTFGSARTQGHFAKHPEHNLTVPDSIHYLTPKRLAIEKKRQKSEQERKS